MATSTEVPIYTTTLSSPAASVVIDLSSYQGYTNLKIVAQTKHTLSLSYSGIQFNNDTTSNYTQSVIYGNGSSAPSNRSSSAPKIYPFFGTYESSSNWLTTIFFIPNYSNTNMTKTVLWRANDSSIAIYAGAGLWRKTPEAITSITISAQSDSGSGTFTAGTTISVYGIGTGSNGVKATGGAIYSDADYVYHLFTSTATFTPTQALSADILVVAGGGSGSSGQSGTYYGFGGGAGEVKYFASQSLTTTGYVCTIGGGGASIGNSTVDTNGNAGTGSTFGALTSAIAGSGANYNSPGGSSGNGFTGGAGNPTACGGGAGAGANGQAAPNSTTPGAGGNGLSTYSSWGSVTGVGQNISGTYWLAGGGGGVYTSTVAAGGYGGGGGGGTSITQLQRNGLVNSGSGGSGGGNTAGNSGQGGSGVIIVRYAK